MARGSPCVDTLDKTIAISSAVESDFTPYIWSCSRSRSILCSSKDKQAAHGLLTSYGLLEECLLFPFYLLYPYLVHTHAALRRFNWRFARYTSEPAQRCVVF